MKPIEALITHECSGAMRRALERQGVRAWSCDTQAAEDGSPNHIRGDAVEAIRSRAWSFIGMHCACTFLGVSGYHWNYRRPERAQKTADALQHVRDCMAAADACGCPWYLENPVSIISTRIRPPDFTLQPYECGEDASKRTCYWTSGLPAIRIDAAWRFAGRMVEWPAGSGKIVERWSNQTDSGQNRLSPGENRAKNRARTYPQIAGVLAAQWSPVILGTLPKPAGQISFL